MSIDVLQTCSIGFWVAAGIFFLTAVALFFLMDIPKLYGEISGRTAKKAIEQIRKHNAEAGATTMLAEAGATTMLTEPGHPQTAENDRQPPEAMDDFVLENELSYAESVEIIE